MKAALLYGVRDLRVVDIPNPRAGPRNVLIQVHACGVCATDLRKFHTLDGGRLKLPMNLGHEFVGTVVEIGSDVQNFELGMRVMGDGFAGYAEYALLDLDSLPSPHVPMPITIPSNVSNAAATFAEPLAACIHAVMNQAALKPGQTVLITGGGKMGQLLLMVAKEMGAQTLLSEPEGLRRTMALSLGADAVIDPQTENVRERVLSLNGKRLADAAILTVGVPALVQPALETVRPGGCLVLFAAFPHSTIVEIDPNLIHYREVALVGSDWVGVPPNSNIDHFRRSLELIETGRIPVERLITGSYPLSQIDQAFAAAARIDMLKIIVVP